MAPVFSAVLYLHSKGIMHRDLKPENFLLTEKTLKVANLKIADFGLACRDETSTVVAGSPYYIAPEIISNKPYDKRCDLWSLGVILFLLLSGELPFHHLDIYESFKLTTLGTY
jgi:calcium-dependent protein kinase